jgi:hypothetical protein
MYVFAEYRHADVSPAAFDAERTSLKVSEYLTLRHGDEHHVLAGWVAGQPGAASVVEFTPSSTSAAAAKFLKVRSMDSSP